jgi:hypothetical protein
LERELGEADEQPQIRLGWRVAPRDRQLFEAEPVLRSIRRASHGPEVFQ